MPANCKSCCRAVAVRASAARTHQSREARASSPFNRLSFRIHTFPFSLYPHQMARRRFATKISRKAMFLDGPPTCQLIRSTGSDGLLANGGRYRRFPGAPAGLRSRAHDPGRGSACCQYEARVLLFISASVVYFAGDIDMYGDNFVRNLQGLPRLFIVAIPGNHDCQPDDPQDGPVDPNKKPLDGWIQNCHSSRTPRPTRIAQDAGFQPHPDRTSCLTSTGPLTRHSLPLSSASFDQTSVRTNGEIHKPSTKLIGSMAKLAAADSPAMTLLIGCRGPSSAFLWRCRTCLEAVR